jgi:membrane-bound lytic murein transglycosylase D
MRKILIINLFLLSGFAYAGDTLVVLKADTVLVLSPVLDKFSALPPPQLLNIYDKRLRVLDAKTPMSLAYNEKVKPFIDNYLGRNKALISRMQGLKELYFPLFEQQLDKYDLPLEFKYLAIVESALNPRAKSASGATGLWQFMYLTGKEYGLEATSYMDERQDPLKSTQAACKYFVKLYDIFGDWNLVLAAYNGGPGYLQRKINSVGSFDFWELYPHLRKETRNYIPIFIAVNYAMNYANEHDISVEFPGINITKTDTLQIKKQVEISTISEMLCLNRQTINYLNPSYKKDVFPVNSILVLPSFAVNDFLDNEQANYLFIDAVETKEILINEERIVYRAIAGDYLGRIAKEFGVKVFELKEWNKLTNTGLDIGDKLVIYIKKNQCNIEKDLNVIKNEYIVRPGDTLWEIAKKHDGLSIWKIKSLNNMESDKLKPGTKIILPTT